MDQLLNICKQGASLVRHLSMGTHLTTGGYGSRRVQGPSIVRERTCTGGVPHIYCLVTVVEVAIAYYWSGMLTTWRQLKRVEHAQQVLMLHVVPLAETLTLPTRMLSKVTSSSCWWQALSVLRLMDPIRKMCQCLFVRPLQHNRQAPQTNSKRAA